jgi:hypothetical protein
VRWAEPFVAAVVMGGPVLAQDPPQQSTMERIFYGEPIEDAAAYLDPERGVTSPPAEALRELVARGACASPSLGMTGPHDEVLAVRCAGGELYWIDPEGSVTRLVQFSSGQ